MGEFKRRSHEQEKPSVDIVRAAPEDAEAICDIRDRAWLKAYTVDAPDLKITEEDVLLAAKGPDDRFFKNRVEYLKKRLAEDSGQNLWLYVAKIDGKVVGYTRPSLDDRGRRRIGAMYVDPAQ